MASGIPILTRVPIPDEMVPPDSKVEIDAKIAAGYFAGLGKDGKEKEIVTGEDLGRVKGRSWV